MKTVHMMVECKFCGVYTDTKEAYCCGCGAPLDKKGLNDEMILEKELKRKQEEIRLATNEANNKTKEMLIKVFFTFLQLGCVMLALAQILNIPLDASNNEPPQVIVIDALFIPIGIAAFFFLTALKRTILRGFLGKK